MAKRPLGAAVAAVFELVLSDFATEGVAVNAKEASGAALIACGVLHGAFDEAPFKFRERLIE